MRVKIATLPTEDPDFIADPYPLLGILREDCPVFYDDTVGLWFITRYDAVRRVQTDKSFGSTYRHRFSDDEFGHTNKQSKYPRYWEAEKYSLLLLEPPDHTRIRSLVAKAFQPKEVIKLNNFMQAEAARLLDPLRGEEFDLLVDVAQPYSISVIGKLLGVPKEDHGRFLDWSHKIVKMYDLQTSPKDADIAEIAADEFIDYSLYLIKDRRTNPRQDLITRLTLVVEGNEKLSDHEIVSTMILLLNAGHEATVNVIGNGISALLSFYGSTHKAGQYVNDVVTLIEELIRWDSPLQFFQRWVLADNVEFEGIKVPPMEKVAILLGSANRDPRAFDNPDELIVDRANNSHTSWGGGVHFCLGAHLARQELDVMFTHVLSQNISLVDQPERTGAFGIRGFKAVNVFSHL
jgi:cytochrome P450